MKGFCESGCGAMIQVFGCKWCPDCAPVFSMGHSLGEVAFMVIAGKYENFDGELIENVKFSSDLMLLKDAEETLKKHKGYHFARIEYVDPDGENSDGI